MDTLIHAKVGLPLRSVLVSGVVESLIYRTLCGVETNDGRVSRVNSAITCERCRSLHGAQEVAEDIAKAFDGSWPRGKTVFHSEFKHEATVKEEIYCVNNDGTRYLGYVRVEFVERGKSMLATWKWADCQVVD